MQTLRHFWRYFAKFFLEVEMFQTQVVQKIRTQYNVQQLFSENRTLYEIMSKNMVETSQYGAYESRVGLASLYARMRMHTPTGSVTHMHRRTCKHAHTDQYVILIAVPQQQWLRERTSMFRYIYIASIVMITSQFACVLFLTSLLGAVCFVGQFYHPHYAFQFS